MSCFYLLIWYTSFIKSSDGAKHRNVEVGYKKTCSCAHTDIFGVKREIGMRRRILFTVEKKRVLVPVGEPCPFGCRYCYTRGGEVGLERVSIEEVIDHFQKFMSENTKLFETIQFGYDGDPFSHPERGIAMLQQLATMQKHINFSTKAFLHGPILSALTSISKQIEAAHRTFSALISLSCWNSASIVEPYTPSPSERMQSIANLKKIDMVVFIALRPILPHIQDHEYERIIDEGLQAGCDGFVLGPLYADEKRRFVRFIPTTVLESTPSRTGTVPWSAHAPIWTRYEDRARLQRFLRLIEAKGGRTFTSSADAMDFAQQRLVIAR
jgi:DNA repair photolyase